MSPSTSKKKKKSEGFVFRWRVVKLLSHFFFFFFFFFASSFSSLSPSFPDRISDIHSYSSLSHPSTLSSLFLPVTSKAVLEHGREIFTENNLLFLLFFFSPFAPFSVYRQKAATHSKDSFIGEE